MDFIRAFLITGVEGLILIGVIVGGIVAGRKLRDKKENKREA
ncbi:hypothetical protein [Konateibacter massiliensis]|nr:hypothetical protein [Konateibacter massiliensis]